ncbi:odorant receptor 131-2-like [Hyla sarda]|uniref:odorant receptor 131-2-like n=1 Tax=Hyla sarda TaxID=327740 RepID=UPI0024C363BA|nr:odorant receptor 131-2-like [Hyla sarda]
MVNSSELSNDTTTQVITALEIVRITVLVLMIPFFGIFVFYMVIILKVFFTTPNVRETARYILFIHMLFNDTTSLVTSYFLFLCAIYRVVMPIPVCLVITFLPTTRITSYNLAIMSLERYAAICHPLRYAEWCTAQRSCYAIAYMWTLGLIPKFINLIAYYCSVDSRTFYLKVICDWRSLELDFQVVMRIFFDTASFSIMGIIIAYTYVKVMMVARRMDSGKLASKAGKTVLLHAFQLLLSMFSLTNVITEKYLTIYFRYLPLINFFLVMCLPRFISPLIYGLRDEVFGKSMRKPGSCLYVKVHVDLKSRDILEKSTRLGS